MILLYKITIRIIPTLTKAALRRRFFNSSLMTQEQLYDNRVRIGERIAQIREEKGLTQQQVADTSGLKRSHISRLENGGYNVGIDIISKVAAVLECEVDIIQRSKS